MAEAGIIDRIAKIEVGRHSPPAFTSRMALQTRTTARASPDSLEWWSSFVSTMSSTTARDELTESSGRVPEK